MVSAWTSAVFRAALLASLPVASLVFVPGVALAGPDSAKEAAASDAFKAGADDFKAKNFGSAADHFEAADTAIPSPKTLRLAIRARTEANELARAATLSALAIELYSDNVELAKLATDTILKNRSQLQEVHVSCASPCVVKVSGRAVHGEARPKWTIYVDPARVTLGAVFFGNLLANEQKIDAVPGGKTDVKLEPPKDAPKPPSTPPDGPKVTPPSDGLKSPPPDRPKITLPPDNTTPPNTTPPNTIPDTPAPKPHWGIHPAVFGVSLGATAVLGGVTIWSGIDTKNNPGVDAVKKDCAGQGTSCPTYQEGLSHEKRTNGLIGATSVLAAATVVFAIVTNWHGKDPVVPSTTDGGKDAAGSHRHCLAGGLCLADARVYADSIDPVLPQGAPSPAGPGWPVGGVLGLRGKFE